MDPRPDSHENHNTVKKIGKIISRKFAKYFLLVYLEYEVEQMNEKIYI
jgi:hypothetical protein